MRLVALRHHHWVGSTNVAVMVDVGVGVITVVVSMLFSLQAVVWHHCGRGDLSAWLLFVVVQRWWWHCHH